VRFVEAFIRGFGRFAERPFRFAPGAQLFVGPNEAGKSTLQRFLLAMLFGLKREDRKRRDYLPEYELYGPWSGAPYGGRLVYSLGDGRRFEVHRLFERQQEDIRLFDAVSGRDLSADYPLDHRKERPFLQAQLQLSRQLFEATTSLGQLAGRMSEDGAGALRERIQGLLDSGDENLSARAALTRLERLREHFGSERTPTRGLGMLLRQRRDLQQEMEEAQARHAEILQLHRQRNAVAAEYTRYEKAWEVRRRTELVQERRQLALRLQRVGELDGEIETLTARLASYTEVGELDVTAYSKVREESAALSALTLEIQGRREELEGARSSLEAWRRFASRLSAALGDLDPAGARLLEERAEGLRETIGRVREARRREEEERRRNRTIVEALQQHRGRDWTDDAFMRRLAVTRAQLTDVEAGTTAESARASLRDYRHKRLHVLWQVSLVLGGVVALAALFWRPLHTLPVSAWLPLGAAGLLVLLFCSWRVRGVMAARDQARAAALQAQNAAQRQQEAKDWLAGVLQRHGMGAVEELEAARREYESLRAEAERISAAGSRERSQLEAELASRADALHAQVHRCDLAGLAALRADPQAAARGMPPFEEASGLESPAGDDSAELQRLGEDLRRLPALRHACAWAERLRLECEARQRRVEQEMQALEQRQSRVHQIQDELGTLLRHNGARDVDDFAARVVRHEERQALVALLRPLQHERQGVLGGETPEALRGRLRLLESVASQAGLFDDVPRGAGVQEDLSSASLESLGRRKDALAAERAQLGERLAARESEGRFPAEIELQAQEVDEHIAAEKRRLAALQLAMETLEQVTTKRHREAAPRMNERVGEVFARLSRGEHREVRLDEDLTPRVRMDGEGYCGAESLSGGAADQLYFALRVTAGEQLARAGEFLPLLLDDPFVQYDPERLQAGLDLVAELAREHQVCFFTCEVAQAEDLGARLRAAGVEYGLERL
jgi:uncharacterized protein YhaN